MSELNNNIRINAIEDGDNNTDFYANFKQKLIDVEQFPLLYTFKFIVTADADKIEAVKNVFTHTSAKYTEKESSGGKYKSITVEVFVNHADEVIDYYKKVSKIESVIML
ncbi:DUF493 domain-containing protein [Sphingobacterium sp. SRCM116780]|uniref:HP0495 family protein n=1 Tax=Sphingobacterium sp. SRCM116780 TaxID=2907623 RepID=UPI001F1E505F|nr:DUF493 domain-containing protein [Sphingobacterium sp. SRCM116780]UIR55257.1 DUF493 domain-containing protein [Sphingobacterium sp. SRCM116780]